MHDRGVPSLLLLGLITTLTISTVVLHESTASSVAAQESTDEAGRVVAVVEASLEAISDEDMVGFTDLMIDEAVIIGASEADGEPTYRPRRRAEERATQLGGDVVERGFDPEVRIAGPVATVWLPYDLYVDNEWSHCGVDTFTLVDTPEGWRIAAAIYSIEQPPACQRHPDGPPGR